MSPAWSAPSPPADGAPVRDTFGAGTRSGVTETWYAHSEAPRKVSGRALTSLPPM